MKLAFVCFCIFAVACFHDAVLLSVYDKKEVTFCFWNGEKLTNNTIHPTAASVVAITLAQRCKVHLLQIQYVPWSGDLYPLCEIHSLYTLHGPKILVGTV